MMRGSFVTDATGRFDLIAPYLDRYTRRFTVLDLGSNDGTLAKMIASKYDAVVVAVEMNQHEFGADAYKGYNHIICLQHKMTGEELRLLSECEHFDVVLCLNFLHWFGDDWEEATKAVLNMGDFIFVQIPKDGDERAPGVAIVPKIRKMMMGRGTGWIGETVQFPRHEPRPLWVTKPERWDRFKRSTVASPDGSYIFVKRGFEHCLAIKVALRRPWIHGINLWNFCLLGGVWPTKEKVLDMLRHYPLPETTHGDIVPHNFILDGGRIHLIDGHEGWGGDDRECLEKTIAKVGEYLCS